VQVEPIKPTLKAPGIKRFKLKYDGLLSIFAFNFNLRRYNKAEFAPESIGKVSGAARGLCQWAGAYTRPLLSST